MTAGAAGGAPKAPPSVLARVTPRIEAVVRHVQPRASFGNSRDILLGQYLTGNYLIHPQSPDGRKLPPYQELGPLPGGFYLQLSVLRGNGGAMQVTQPTADRPWTTVTSYYRLPRGRVIVMTWEATPGAPRGIAPRISSILSSYAATIK